MTQSENALDLQDRYQDAVASYLQALDAGGNPDRWDWLARYSDVADRLGAFFQDHDRMRRVVEPSTRLVSTASFGGESTPAAGVRPAFNRVLPLLGKELVELAEEAGAAPNEAGFGALQSEKGCLPLAALEVHAEIEGLMAHVRVCQTFVNTLDVPLEATYIFPLPDRMAVNRFHMQVAGREVEGVLQERAAARRTYQQAVRRGQRAAIAEEDRPDVFTLRVGNLMPGEEAVVELALVGPIPYSNGQATFRFPLVVAPRYVPGTPLPERPVGSGAARDTAAVPDASRITPPVLLPGFPNPVRLSIAVDIHPSNIPMTDFRSSLHSVLEAEDGDGVRRIILQAGERLDRDFILRFRIGESAIRSALALLPDDAASKEGTFALTVVPPADQLTRQKPRDVVFVLDRSGSMEGWKMVAARRAMARMVDTLTEQDRFAVFAFDNRVEGPDRLGLKLSPASHRNRYWAVEYLDKVHSRGGTEMLQPLDMAVHMLTGGDPSRERILVLVTDAEISNEQQILRNLSGRTANLRIFALGIDQAVNEGFLRQLTSLGNGSYEVVESEDRLEEVMDQINRRMGNPVLTEVRIEADGFALLTETLTPHRLPDVFPGVPLCVWGRYQGEPRGSLVLQARDGEGRPWFATVPARQSRNPAITPIWARGQVRTLEDQYAADKGDRAALERQILQTSLRFNVLCRFTAFVAVDKTEVVNTGGRLQPVTQAVELPTGWEARVLNARLLGASPIPAEAQALAQELGIEIEEQIGRGGMGEVYKARMRRPPDDIRDGSTVRLGPTRPAASPPSGLRGPAPKEATFGLAAEPEQPSATPPPSALLREEAAAQRSIDDTDEIIGLPHVGLRGARGGRTRRWPSILLVGLLLLLCGAGLLWLILWLLK